MQMEDGNLRPGNVHEDDLIFPTAFSDIHEADPFRVQPETNAPVLRCIRDQWHEFEADSAPADSLGVPENFNPSLEIRTEGESVENVITRHDTLINILLKDRYQMAMEIGRLQSSTLTSEARLQKLEQAMRAGEVRERHQSMELDILKRNFRETQLEKQRLEGILNSVLPVIMDCVTSNRLDTLELRQQYFARFPDASSQDNNMGV